MTYKEFKNAIKDWGRVYGHNPVVEGEFDYVYITFRNDDYFDLLCEIHKSERRVVNLNWETYRNLSENAKWHLFDIVTEFAETKPEDREYKETKDKDREEFKSAIDSIINRLEIIQTDAEDVMNWTIEEIQERSWNLRNNLEDIIIDLEKVKEANRDEE